MKILITAGPTREYLDDVRFLTNGSSGKMGYAIAAAAITAGHDVVLVSGPVTLPVPDRVVCHRVRTSDEMLQCCLQQFPACDGVIAAAAVCDYRPVTRRSGKMSKTGGRVSIEFEETVDILRMLGERKADRWSVGFALESEDGSRRAIEKLRNKHCDAIVLNGPAAIDSDSNTAELIAGDGTTAANWSGSKHEIARLFVQWIGKTFTNSGSTARTENPR